MNDKEMVKKYNETSDEKITDYSIDMYPKEIEEELIELIKSGKKVATSSLYDAYEIEEEELPKVGTISVVNNNDGNAECIVKLTKVEIVKFNEVTKEHALKEGEGDLSLEFWRTGHEKFFINEYKEYGLNDKFNEDTLIVCEEFEVIFK